MKKLALCFSSKDRVELTAQSIYRIPNHVSVFWNDGSTEEQSLHSFEKSNVPAVIQRTRVTGGPDRAIVFGLTQMLESREQYTHVGLLENDVLLDPDWFEPTMALFDNREGLSVGAVSARSYRDRVLLQRDGHAVMHNVGAGHAIFTRQAAEIILANYRTGWWPENRRVFSHLSGIDIGKFAAFHHNAQPITADWSWDTILAAHGLATVALTPSKATMIGEDIAGQGLALVSKPIEERRDDLAFERFRESLINIQDGRLRIPAVDHLLRAGPSTIIFPHHAGKYRGRYGGNWRTRWSQGFGPFSYVAQDNATLSIQLFGQVAFHVTGGKVAIRDSATAFNTELDLTDATDMVTIPVPRDSQFGKIELTCGPGAALMGIEVNSPQPTWDVPFDYNSLPETV